MKQLFKLSLACAAILLISPSAFAHGYTERQMDNAYDDGYDDGYDDAKRDCPCPPGMMALAYWYFGGSLGYDSYMSTRQAFYSDERIGSFRTHANGWYGNVFGGYGRTFNNHLYLGGEGFLGLSGANGSDRMTWGDFHGRFSAGTSYGASLMPGYRLQNGTLVYTRLGVTETRLTTQDYYNGYGTSDSSWTTGYTFGLGTEVNLTKQIGMRLEYTYINYNDFNRKGQMSIKNEPSDNRGSVGFVYRLDPSVGASISSGINPKIRY